MTTSSRPSVDRFDHLHFIVADFEKSLAFYSDVLGWGVLKSWSEPGQPRGALISGGGIKVVISEKRAAGPQPVLHLDIHDVNVRFKVMAKGDHVVAPPGTSPSGAKWFVVRDPDGNEIAFEEHPRGG